MSKESKLHVLVMTANWQSALACIQSFGRKGHTVSIISNKVPHPNYRSIFVKHVFFLNDEKLDERARELMHLVELRSIELVVPISDHDALVVARARQLFPDADALIESPFESVSITRSRNRTTELCRLLNIDTPKTIFVTHDGASSAASELGYPCFLKLSGTVASQGVFQISSEAELDARLGLVPKDMEMQLQTGVEGDFVGITGFASDGKVLENFAFGCDYIYSRAGTPAYSKRVRDERLTDILCKVAGELRWTGGIDLDLLQRTDGSFVLLEINPRFSGTIVFPLKLGIDFPMYYVNAKLGIAGSPRFTPAHPGAERFVSLFEETNYLRFAGEAGKALPASFRADGKWVDNAFWDDPRYSAEFFQYVRTSLLYTKR